MKAVLYLGAGVAAGLSASRFGILPPLELDHARAAQVLIEATLVVSLYCAGLKLAATLEQASWRLSLRLTTITMPVTAALTAGAARVLLGMPIEDAVLLGAILAPADALLGSCLELPDGAGQSAARSVLSGEGALSSSLALPLVLLALGCTGVRDLGPFAARWLALDLAWAVGGGVLFGAALGTVGARVLSRLDARSEAGWLIVLLAASTLASTYGAALILQVDGLVAALAAGIVFARGGVALRRMRGTASRREASASVSNALRLSWAGGARAGRLARRLTAGAERIERVLEAVAVLLIGALLAGSTAHPGLVLFALVLLVAIRPLAARLGIGAAPLAESDRQSIAWFGVRGIASLYYLSLSLSVGDSAGLAAAGLTATTLAVLATSIALHGVTALPLGKRPAGAQGSR